MFSISTYFPCFSSKALGRRRRKERVPSGLIFAVQVWLPLVSSLEPKRKNSLFRSSFHFDCHSKWEEKPFFWRLNWALKSFFPPKQRRVRFFLISSSKAKRRKNKTDLLLFFWWRIKLLEGFLRKFSICLSRSWICCLRFARFKFWLARYLGFA